jgi:intracellular septation protein
MIPLTDLGWMTLTRRLMLFFLGLAVLNEVIWRTQSEEIWVYFKTFGLTAAIFLFFMAQGALFRDHSTEKDDDAT